MVREPGNREAPLAVTVAIPTLAAGETLAACLASLERQTFQDFEVVVVDNSGTGAVKASGRVRVIANEKNVGFGAAVNQAFQRSSAPFLAVLNDAASSPAKCKVMRSVIHAYPGL